MSIVAVTPATHMIAANEALAEQGFGPSHFSVAAFTGSRATHAALHAWNDATFAAAVKALPGVAYEESEGDPVTRTKALIESQGAQWGNNAPPLTGQVQAGKLYRHTDGSLWWVVQSYSATTYPDPTAIPALVRRARRPGVAEPWVQPIDQYDAYLLADPFTGQPEQCLHAGKRWVTLVDVNVWVPGAVGSGNLWRELTPDGEPIPANDWPDWVQPTGGHDAYSIGDQVTFGGQHYVSTINGNVWSPSAYPAGWQVQP